MKIQSRKETKKRLSAYIDHDQTEIHEGQGLHLVTVYHPAIGDPPDAVPTYYFAFGMDGRRVVFTLEQAEILNLRERIDECIKRAQLRQVK